MQKVRGTKMKVRTEEQMNTVKSLNDYETFRLEQLAIIRDLYVGILSNPQLMTPTDRRPYSRDAIKILVRECVDDIFEILHYTRETSK